MFSHHLIAILMLQTQLVSLGLARPILHMLWAAWHSHRSYQNRKLDMFKRRSLQHQTNVPFLAKVPSIEKIESKLPSRV
jgi:uncharacterized membrane protein YjgN (DUF898 family)